MPALEVEVRGVLAEYAFNGPTQQAKAREDLRLTLLKFDELRSELPELSAELEEPEPFKGEPLPSARFAEWIHLATVGKWKRDT